MMDIVSHILIAATYLVLAGAFLFIELDTPRETLFARLGAFLFFLGCAIHHVDMLVHIEDGTPLESPSFHHTTASLFQVIGAPMFLVTAGPYLSRFLRGRRGR